VLVTKRKNNNNYEHLKFTNLYGFNILNLQTCMDLTSKIYKLVWI